MSSLFRLRKPYILLGVIALFGWFFFFFRSEFFDIRGIEIQTSGGFVTEGDVLPIVLQSLDAQSARPWSSRHLFFLPEEKVEEGIRVALYAEDVKVGEIDNGILRLSISFGSRFLYTTQNGELFLKCAVARPAGIVLEDPVILNAVKKRYLVSTDFTTQSLDGLVYIRKTTSTLEVPVIKRLLELARSLDDHETRFAHFEERSSTEVSVQLDRDRQLLMDLNQPLVDQVERGQALLREKEYKDLKPLTIDLRIPGRAYLR